MKTIIHTAIIATFTFAAFSTEAYSSSKNIQAMANNSLMSFQEALELIQKEGYGEVYEIEREYGYIKAKVIGPNAERLKLAVSSEPQKIEVMKRKAAKYNKQFTFAMPPVKLTQVLDILSQQGYSNVDEIELEKGYYDVELRDQKGYKQELMLDALTGEILPQSNALRR